MEGIVGGERDVVDVVGEVEGFFLLHSHGVMSLSH